VSRTIQIVEDDADIRRVVRLILEAGGYQVTDTGSPVDAVDLARAVPPDLVLCDLAMPVMDGYGVVRALQADPVTAHVPVVFLTARREPKERVQAFRFGVVDYITKPFTREVLLGRIDRILGTLHDRSGAVGDEGGGVQALLERLAHEGRSGVLSLRGQDIEAALILQGGVVIEGTLPSPLPPALKAEFRELDLNREDIARHNPPSLPGDPAVPVSLESLPEPFRTVLVVDDSETFRTFLRDVLARKGFVVHEAGDGDEGLRVALQKRPWLILADVSMPRMNGIDFCRAVRRHSIIAHTPFIFLSGWDDYKDRYAGLEAGGDEYLPKDTSVRELLLRIQLILGRLPALPLPSGGDSLSGRLEVLGAPGLLQMCHHALLTGHLRVLSDTRSGEVAFRDGEVIAVVAPSATGIPALQEILSWPGGHFHFEPGNPGPGSPLDSFAHLLLEACRLLDDARRSPVSPS
jgi:DNA-binding response OmpR family regulator